MIQTYHFLLNVWNILIPKCIMDQIKHQCSQCIMELKINSYAKITCYVYQNLFVYKINWCAKITWYTKVNFYAKLIDVQKLVLIPKFIIVMQNYSYTKIIPTQKLIKYPNNKSCSKMFFILILTRTGLHRISSSVLPFLLTEY